jgi:hypothetical protein
VYTVLHAHFLKRRHLLCTKWINSHSLALSYHTFMVIRIKKVYIFFRFIRSMYINHRTSIARQIFAIEMQMMMRYTHILRDYVCWSFSTYHHVSSVWEIYSLEHMKSPYVIRKRILRIYTQLFLSFFIFARIIFRYHHYTKKISFALYFRGDYSSVKLLGVFWAF